VNQYYETRSIKFSFFFLTMACVVCGAFQFFAKNGVLIIFLTVLTWMCAYGHEHMMVTHIQLDATIWHWLGYLTHNNIYLCFLHLLLFLMLITMVFLASLLPPPIRLLLFVQPALLGLHYIFKLATHIRHHLDHFHSLATSCKWLLLMNIGLLYLSPIDIMFGVINGSCSFGLLIQLATNCPLELCEAFLHTLNMKICTHKPVWKWNYYVVVV